ncbi:hypothetical protein WH47_03935 [Habropoda laboriosa]|uniref:Uncharacterized protein n=1 Tax=Habropoda laboriosa TaxID=597456 RepID=A0A0L7QU39_9HYME|nr:hypothetical protein WH47_03935 [Habropoda laboriosa]
MRIPCNTKTCKIRKKLNVYKSVQLTKDSRDNLQVSKNANGSIKNETVSQKLQESEELSKSAQKNLTSQLYKVYTDDKIIDTYDEKMEQPIPTKDTFHTKLGVNNSNMNYVHQEAVRKEKFRSEIDKSIVDEIGDIDLDAEDICAKDKKIFDKLQKELLSEKKRSKVLEMELESLTCSLNCLKEDNEQRAACLKGALETAKEQTKVAMNLVKQTNDQADLTTADRNELSNEIARLQEQVTEIARKNTVLLKERDNLKNKLQSLSEDESKRITLDIKCMLQSYKITELSEVKGMLQSNNSILQDMKEKVEHLEYCLCEETKTCHYLKEEFETLQENHSSEIRIKEKIVEEQNKTISKQKKLLHDSEEMVQQVASEFNQLKDELHEEKQKSKSLQISLDKIDDKLNKAYISQCEQCRTLTAEIDYLKWENQRTTAVARLTYQKLHQSMKAYEKKVICEKQQHRYMALVIKKKDQQIEILRSQIHENNMRTF